MLCRLKKIVRIGILLAITGFFAFSHFPFEIVSRALTAFDASQNIVGIKMLKIPEAYAAAGDARMQYGSGTNATPQTRFYTDSSDTWDAAGPTAAGTANVGWAVSKESPTEDITVMATQSTTGVLDVFCRSGAVWTKDFTVTIGANAATRRFDVEFEKTSGIPMVLYSRNVATINELGYRRKTGAGCGAGAWTAETAIDPTQITGTVLWVEIEARQKSGTNVIAAAFSDTSGIAGGTLEAMIWNGSSWENESPAASAQGWSDSSIELQGTAGANAAKVFDMAFESVSGDLLVAWGTSTGANGTNGWRYATCAGVFPCAWSGVLTPAGPTDDATNVACAPDPGSDAIACIAEGNAGSDLTGWVWTGAAVGAAVANADTTLSAVAAGDQHVDIDWVVSGSQRMAVGVYADVPSASTPGVRYIYYDTAGTAWRTNAGAGFILPGALNNIVAQSIQATKNPNNAAHILVNFTNANSDLWSKWLAYNGAAGGATTPLSTWTSSDGGSALELSISSITSMPFWFDWIRIGPHASSYTNGTESALNFSACAANGCGARPGQSITITGTNFGSGPCDGSANMVRIGTYTLSCAGSLWSSASITITVDSGITVYGGQGASGLIVRSAGIDDPSPLQFWVFPDITSFTPAPEGKETATVTISGTRFDTSLNQGTVTIAGIVASIQTWSDTSITVTIPEGIPDSTNTGDVVVTRAPATGSKTDTSTGFTLLPEIITIAACSVCSANADREFDTGVSTYGIIMLSGRHFGTGGSATILGVLAPLHTATDGPCTTTTYTNTDVCYEVPSLIGNSTYTGDIVLTRTAGPADSKQDTFAGFRILPKIASISPSNGLQGTAVTITGDHLCQDSGACPSAFDASNKVTFTSGVDAALFTSWTNTVIQTEAPSGVSTGNVTVTSNIRISNGKNFTVDSTIPNDPSELEQYKSDGATPISVGSATNGSSVVLKASMSGYNPSTLCLQIQNAGVATLFDGITITAQEGGLEQQSCKSYTGTSVTGVVTLTGLLDGASYHWRARVKNNGTGEVSQNWISFGGNAENPPTNPAETDFFIDTTAPVISNAHANDPSSSTCDALTAPSDIQAKLCWSTNENTDEQVAWRTSCPAGQASAAATFSALAKYQPASPTGSGATHSQTIGGLSGGTTYQYMVRSADGAGNVSYDPPTANTCNTLTTSANTTRIMKTNEYFIQSAPTQVLANWYPASFIVFIPESNTAKSNITFKSVIIEISGITVGTGGAGITINANINSQSAVPYTLNDPGSGVAVSWKIAHTFPLTLFKFDCTGCGSSTPNTLYLTISEGGNSSVVSAKAIVTYLYTP